MRTIKEIDDKITDLRLMYKTNLNLRSAIEIQLNELLWLENYGFAPHTIKEINDRIAKLRKERGNAPDFKTTIKIQNRIAILNWAIEK